MHRISKSDLKVADEFLIYYPKMTAVTTKLVTIVKFLTSLIILMACAGGSDL